MFIKGIRYTDSACKICPIYYKARQKDLQFSLHVFIYADDS
jgi:hypothetical protein